MVNIKLSKGQIIAIGVVLLILIALIIVVAVLAKKRKEKTVPLPKDTDWGRTLTDVESAQVVRLADALYKDMKGWNIGGHDKPTYQEYSGTTDKVFVAVADYFAQKYGEGKNLAQWIDEEQYAFHNLTDSIITRLASFGVNI